MKKLIALIVATLLIVTLLCGCNKQIIDLNYEFDYAVIEHKLFEVRKNDRNFQKGDIVQFAVIDTEELHILDRRAYEITYVLTDFPTGLKKGYAVIGIRQLNK